MSGPELVIHGHFYQPPRENPWTEEVGRERSASPFHDWNERIAAESYRPNTMARIVDDHGDIVKLVNNYSLMSYNVGPTLMTWLERHTPDIYERILASDAEGHGAIAQVFGHTILPLATEDDARLQVRWGLEDFKYRFGRDAEGIWLAECAVNDTVLKVLAEEGVKFTVLAPGQARQIRSMEGAHDWVDVDQSWFDTSRPYRWVHPDGEQSVNIVFYNGPLSHALAFELSSLNSQGLVDRMMAAAHGRDGLVTLATDGETFGHHHKFGDRLMAYAMDVEAPNRGLKRTNLNKFVAETSPTHEIRVHESAWSCAHGVGRWKEDCGCETGAQAGWNQRWRSPLRSALNTLRSRVEEVWTARAADVMTDPSTARFEYVRVIMDAESHKAFAATHVKPGCEVEAFTLLEMQRHAQSMFTSCGWFFNDLAGIETIQVLRYAARVVDLLEELGEDPQLDAFLEILAQAHSNKTGEGSGLDIWNRHVVTERVDAARAVEHVALSEVIENETRESFGPFVVEIKGRTREQRGSTVLGTGVACLTHRRTGRQWFYAYAALGLGGLEVAGALREVADGGDEDALEIIRTDFARGDTVANLLRALSSVGDHEFDLSVALPDERERLMSDTAANLSERYAESYNRLYVNHRAALEDLVRYGYDLPPELRAPAEVALEREFQEAVLGAESSLDPAAYDTAVTIARQARAAGFEVESPTTSKFVERLVNDAVLQAVAKPSAGSVKIALDVLKLKDELGVSAKLDACEEAVYFAVKSDTFDPALGPLAEALHVAR